MHLCDGFAVNRQQSGLHVAEGGGSSRTNEPGRDVYVAAFGNDLADHVKPRVVCEVSRRAFFVGAILPVSGVVVLYYCLKRTGLAPVRNVAV